MKKFVYAVILMFSVIFASAIQDIQVSNVIDQGFSVSWRSATSEQGSINYGTTGALGSVVADVRGANNYYIHYVNITGLSAGTTYYFDIVSGADIHNNGGAHYSTQTGATIGFSFPNNRRNGDVFDTSWNATDNVLYTMYIEDWDATDTSGISQIRSGLANYTDSDGFTTGGWQSVLDDFRLSDLSAYFSFSNADVLVLNFYKGDGTSTQLRMPLTSETANVSLISSDFPVLDDFESGVTGWVAGAETNIAVAATTNAYGTSAMHVTSPTSDNYYSGYVSKYIANGQALDWGQYNYLKVVVKNIGNVGTQMKIDIYDNDNLDYDISTTNFDDVFSVTVNLLSKDVWREVYIPLNANLARDNSTGGDGILNPYQAISPNGFIIPGGLQVGFSFASTLADGSISVILDDIQLVTSMPGADVDEDGMLDSAEVAAGLSSSNATDGLADADGDGYNNFNEVLQGTSIMVANNFPSVEGFEGFGYTWTVADDLEISTTNATDTSVASNGSNSLIVSGSATGYYAGYMSAWVQSGAIEWDSSYNSVKFLVRNQGQVGDKVKIQLQDNDYGQGIDVWEFEQVINNTDTWQYYTVLLSQFVDVNPGTGDDTINFEPSANVGGINLIGFAFNSKDPSGKVLMNLDSIEISTINASDDNDGDGLPNTWEIAYGLDQNDATGANGPNGDPDSDGFSNLDEYFAGLIPNSDDKFPTIADFEGIANLNETSWNVTSLTPTIVANTLRLTGVATNYNAGFLGKYVGNFLFDWSSYNFIKVDIRNEGQIGDSIRLIIADNDTPTYAVEANNDDSFSMDITFTDTGITRSYYIPYTAMLDSNSASGNNIQDFSPVSPRYPGVAYLGIAFNSVTGDGTVDVYIDKIELSKVYYETTDVDSDGMLDTWERLYGLVTTSSSGLNGPQGDNDSDDIPNMIEFMNQTSPLYDNDLMIDTDGDGMPNNWETRFGLNPAVNDAGTDTDADGINNFTEYMIGSSPLSVNATSYADTDNDGIPDFWELAYGLNVGVDDSAIDSDGDGNTNLAEYLAGTNPNNLRIAISSGWNLISLGVTNNPQISEVIASINAQGGNIIQAYKFSGGGWVPYPGTDFTISYGESIFVLSTGISYYLPQGEVPASATYQFTTGWNSFSKCIGQTYTAVELGAEINTAGIVIEAIARQVNGSWQFYDYTTSTGMNFTIDKLGGFFVKFAQNYTWTPAK